MTILSIQASCSEGEPQQNNNTIASRESLLQLLQPRRRHPDGQEAARNRYAVVAMLLGAASPGSTTSFVASGRPAEGKANEAKPFLSSRRGSRASQLLERRLEGRCEFSWG